MASLRRTGGRFSVRWHITAWVLAPVIVIGGVAAFVLFQLAEAEFIESIDDDIADTATAVASTVDLSGLGTPSEATQRSVGTSEQALMVVTADGVELAFASGGVDDPDPLPEIGAIPFGELRSRAGTPFELPGSDGVPDYRLVATQLGDGRILVVGTPLTELEEVFRALVGALILVALIAGVAMTIVVSFVTGYVTRPLEGIVRTAEQIGSGALRRRVDVESVEGVDEVARLAGALNAMLDRLEAAFADRTASEAKLRRFVADASHELRTPISAVLGYAELIQTGMAPDTQQLDRAVARIASEGERMRMLVEELLLLARLDQGRPDHTELLDIADLVRIAVDDARAIAPDRSIELRADTAAPVRGDPISLRQAIDNLLTNARVHTPAGTLVTVSVERTGSSVAVTVDDDGPGIDPDDRDQIFDRFFRSERSRSRPGGAGLGLAIVAAIVTSHDGDISVDRSPSDGARFTISLPTTDPS